MKKKKTDREVKLDMLWGKLARTVFAITDYDVYKNRYKPKVSKKEAKKLKTICSKAIDEAIK